MNLSWNDNNAILRDLSHAQGRNVPVEIQKAVGIDDRPPVLNLTEETEECFFANCVGDGDINDGPDLHLIRKMLDEVRENPEDIEVQDVDTFEDQQTIKTECNLQVTVVIDKDKPASEQRIVRKPKRGRNVAVKSLIEAFGEHSLEHIDRVEEQPLIKLLTPSDFENHTPLDIKTDAKKPISVSPENMFKRKPKLQTDVPTFKRKETLDCNSNTNTSASEERKITEMYVPSTLAGELYKKYAEQSKVQEAAKEDIWTKAKREMKERELKRQHQEESVSRSVDEESEVTGIDFIMLPQHRHQLGENCVVCEVLCKKEQEQQ